MEKSCREILREYLGKHNKLNDVPPKRKSYENIQNTRVSIFENSVKKNNEETINGQCINENDYNSNSEHSNKIKNEKTFREEEKYSNTIKFENGSPFYEETIRFLRSVIPLELELEEILNREKNTVSQITCGVSVEKKLDLLLEFYEEIHELHGVQATNFFNPDQNESVNPSDNYHREWFFQQIKDNDDKEIIHTLNTIANYLTIKASTENIEQLPEKMLTTLRAFEVAVEHANTIPEGFEYITQYLSVLKKCNKTKYTPTNELLKIAQSGDAQQEIIEIGPNGTKVPKQVIPLIEWSDANKATRKLLMLLFDRETLAECTLTGKPSPAFLELERPSKNQLDKNIIDDIIYIVSMRSKVPERDVRQAITTKCADENKMLRQRSEKPTKKRKNNSDKENLPPIKRRKYSPKM